jgi:hypothetical protein
MNPVCIATGANAAAVSITLFLHTAKIRFGYENSALSAIFFGLISEPCCWTGATKMLRRAGKFG